MTCSRKHSGLKKGCFLLVTPINSNGLDELVWRACSTCNGQCQEKTYYKTSYKLGKQQRMEEFKGEYMVKRFSLIKYLFISNLEFPRKEK